MTELFLLALLADGTEVRACRVEPDFQVECSVEGREVDCPYLAPRLFEEARERVPLCEMAQGQRIVFRGDRWERVGP